MTDTVAALRGALHDMLAATAFLTFCIRNGRSPSVDDHRLLGERYEKARAALAAEADRGTCGNCHHDPDIHSPVNRELCAVPGCDCPGLLTAAEADRATRYEALLAVAEAARFRASATFAKFDPQPTGPDLLDAIAAYMDRQDDKADADPISDGPHDRTVQADVRRWAAELRAALAALDAVEEPR